MDRVRHVGEAVAAVVAESRYIAEDAADLIEVEYEPLPVVTDPEEAIRSTGDAVLHPERGPNNIALQRTLTFGPVDEDFAKADVVVRRGDDVAARIREQFPDGLTWYGDPFVFEGTARSLETTPTAGLT